ncbi:hypothetical protein [Maribacter sp. 2307ULW6-5]|uniref:hypothetical protein n=1 Tax=Maribacter sp. 2307ULW6-5 TaxID=3386275 RepID=UPI0039BCCA1C
MLYCFYVMGKAGLQDARSRTLGLYRNGDGAPLFWDASKISIKLGGLFLISSKMARDGCPFNKNFNSNAPAVVNAPYFPEIERNSTLNKTNSGIYVENYHNLK